METIKPLLSIRQVKTIPDTKSVVQGSSVNCSNKSLYRAQSPSRFIGSRLDSKNRSDIKSQSPGRRYRKEVKQFVLSEDKESKLLVNSFISIRNGFFSLFTVPESKPVKHISLNPQNMGIFFIDDDISVPEISRDVCDNPVQQHVVCLKESAYSQSKITENLKFEFGILNLQDGLVNSEGLEENNNKNNSRRINTQSHLENALLLSNLLSKQESIRNLESSFRRKYTCSTRDIDKVSSRQIISDFEVHGENVKSHYDDKIHNSSFSDKLITKNAINLDELEQLLKSSSMKMPSLEMVADPPATKCKFLDKFIKYSDNLSHRLVSVSSECFSLRSSKFDSGLYEGNIRSLNLFLNSPRSDAPSNAPELFEIQPKILADSIRSIDSDYEQVCDNPNLNIRPALDYNSNENFNFTQLTKGITANNVNASKTQVKRTNMNETYQRQEETFLKADEKSNNQNNHLTDAIFNSVCNNPFGVSQTGQFVNMKSLPSNFTSFKILEPFNADSKNPFLTELSDFDVMNSQTKVNIQKLNPQSDTEDLKESLPNSNYVDGFVDQLRSFDFASDLNGHQLSFRKNFNDN
jgi:hypothetical protein